MSRTIDQRIVEMRFDNAQFERGVKDTSSLLDRLKDALRLDGGKKGLQEVQSAADAFSLEGIGAGVDNISSKFSALGAIGFSILQDLTRRAMDLGGKLIRGALDPIIGGGRTRAMNMEQANFQFEGLGMDVDATMENALAAVQGTAYGLDEAAVLAANFGATGMEAGQDMEDALRGVSGVAAMAGASYSDIGQIFGTVAGQGRLMGNDLNRLAARGVNAAATMASQMGITEGEFREMVSRGEITFDMFAQGMNEAFGDHATKANETYTGSLSNMRAALSRLGAEYFTPHLERQRTLFNALSPLIDRTSNALAPLMERLHSFLDLRYERFVGFLEMLDSPLTGGRILAATFGLIGEIASTLMSYLGPIGQAFQDIFGGATITGIWSFLNALQNVVSSLALTESQGENLRRTFAGIFAVFDVAIYIIWEVVKMVGRLLGVVFEGAGGFLEFTGRVGDFLVMLRDIIKEGDGLTNLLGIIETVLGGVIRVIMVLIGSLGTVLGMIPWEAIFLKVHGFVQQMGLLGAIGHAVEVAWDAVASVINWIIANTPAFLEGTGNVLTSIGEWLGGVATGISEAFHGALGILEDISGWIVDIIDSISNALSNIDWDTVLSFVNAGLLAGALWVVKDFIGFLKDNFSAGKSLADGINDVLGALGDHLKVLQQDIRANVILKLAAAIALLAGAVWLLSFIDTNDLIASLGAITAVFALLLGATTILTKMGATGAFVKLPILAAGLMLLAGAITLMTIPILILSQLDWEELAKGLTGFAGILAGVIAVSWGLSRVSGNLVAAGLAMIPFAIGMGLMAISLKMLGNLEWDEIGTGLLTMAGALALIAGFMTVVPAHRFVAMGTGLVLVAGAVALLAIPLKVFGNMSWGEIGRGLTTLAGALLILSVATAIMGGTIGGAVAMVIVAGALNVLMGPLDRMAAMGWDQIARGLTMLGGSLGLIAIGLMLMTPTIVGSAALAVAAVSLNLLMGPLERMGRMGWENIGRALTLLGGGLGLLAGGMILMSFGLAGALVLPIAAAGLLMLVPALERAGNLEWDVILTGLGALAGLFAVLGAAGLLLAPVTPIILLLSIAIGVLGVGLLGVGAGTLLFAAGIAAMGMAFSSHGQPILDMIDSLIERIPKLLIALARGVADFVVALAEDADRIVAALDTLLGTVLNMIEDRIPDFGGIIQALLDEVWKSIGENTEPAAEAAGLLLQALIDFLDEHTEDVLDAAGRLIDRFLTYLEEEGVEQAYRAGVVGRALVDAFIAGILGDERPEQAGQETADEFVGGIGGYSSSGYGGMRMRIATSSLMLGVASNIERMKEPIFRPAAEATVRTFLAVFTGRTTSDQASSAGGNMVSRVGQGIGTATPLVRPLATALVSVFTTGISNGRNALLTYGGFMVNRLIDGIRASRNSILLSAAIVVSGIGQGLRDRWDAFKTMGRLMIPQILNGIREGITNTLASVGTQGGRLATALRTGFVNGITSFSSLSSIASAGRTMARSAFNAARSWLQSRSPSRKFMKLGKDVDDGFAIGIEKFSDRVYKSSGNMAKKSLNSVAEALSYLPRLYEDMDFQDPVIKPVLDLSDIEKGAGRLSAIFGDSNLGDMAYGRAAGIANDKAEMRKLEEALRRAEIERPSEPKVSFTQNNHSPKALSDIEIYRQTKNQLSSMLGVSPNNVN